jgi:hypothetical protein
MTQSYFSLDLYLLPKENIMAQASANQTDITEQLKEQAADLKKIRAKLTQALDYHIQESGDIKGPTSEEDILFLSQALDIICKSEREALRDLQNAP